MRRIRVVMLALLAMLAGIAMWRQSGNVDAAGRQSPDPSVVVAPTAPLPTTGTHSPDADDAFLPPEARATLALIAADGPFPYDRDGLEFRNFEHRLPARPRGWYHEYTVPTPGENDRGARRIITGGTPPTEWWYTDDHYGSFREVGGAR